MFGFGLDRDEWAVVLGAAFLALRLLYTFGRAVWLAAADRGPPGIIKPVVSLLSGLAASAVAVGAVSIWRGGQPGVIRFVEYAFSGGIAFFLGVMFDMTVEIRTYRLWLWLTSLRVPQYRERLHYSDEEARLAAATKLSYLGERGRAALPELLAAFKDDSAEVRAAAVLAALSMIPDPPEGPEPEAVRAARSALTDTDVRVRAVAAAVLVRLNTATPTEVLPTLCEGLTQTGENTPLIAAEALGKLGPAAVPAIAALRDSALRAGGQNYAAATALGKIGAPAVPALIEILERAEPMTQLLAAEALGDMGEPARVALPALRRLSLQTDNVASGTAKTAVTKLGGDIGG